MEENGFPALWSAAMGTGLEQVKQAGQAQVNLVLSWSGLAAAREMERTWGIPYITGVSIGADGTKALLAALEQTLRNKQSRARSAAAEGPSPILVVAEQVLANSLRAALRANGCQRGITVASFFGWEKTWTQPGDQRLRDEADLEQLLARGGYTALTGLETRCYPHCPARAALRCICCRIRRFPAVCTGMRCRYLLAFPGNN